MLAPWGDSRDPPALWLLGVRNMLIMETLCRPAFHLALHGSLGGCNVHAFLDFGQCFPSSYCCKSFNKSELKSGQREGVLGKNKFQLWVDFSVIPSFLEIKDAYNYDFFA